MHEPVPARALEVRGFATGSLAQADGWVFAPEWLDDLRAELRRRIAETDPTRPRHRAAVRRRGQTRSSRCSDSSAGARSSTCPVPLRSSTRARPLELETRARARRATSRSRSRRALAERSRGARPRSSVVGDGSAIGRAAYASARDLLVAECEAAGSITLARFRDLLGSSRRPAQLLLERFDADGLTRRVGDARVLRRRG